MIYSIYHLLQKSWHLLIIDARTSVAKTIITITLSANRNIFATSGSGSFNISKPTYKNATLIAFGKIHAIAALLKNVLAPILDSPRRVKKDDRYETLYLLSDWTVLLSLFTFDLGVIFDVIFYLIMILWLYRRSPKARLRPLLQGLAPRSEHPSTIQVKTLSRHQNRRQPWAPVEISSLR